MDARELTRPDSSTPALGETRAEVLDVLRAAGEPLAARDVAHRVDLHANTARFHLDALVEAGLAERAVEDRSRPGRPRVLYAARPEGGAAGRRSYRLLAEILTSYMAAETPRPEQAALTAGRAWGRYLTDRRPPFRRVDTAAAVRELVHTLADIGFAPEAVTSSGERQIRLHHCPFREAAEQHGEVVCAVHLGLMQGMLNELNAPVRAARLDPFVEPSLCITHLAPRGDTEPAEDD